jgi:predicted nucleic acid-binding protein
VTPVAVIDCSVVMGWCFTDEANNYTRAVLAALSAQSACVPSVWPLEVGNTLVVMERRRRIDTEKSEDFLRRLTNLYIDIEREPDGRIFGEILALARKHQLSTYDASYLDVALRRELPLATQDKALMRAAAAWRCSSGILCRDLGAWR